MVYPFPPPRIQDVLSLFLFEIPILGRRLANAALLVRMRMPWLLQPYLWMNYFSPFPNNCYLYCSALCVFFVKTVCLNGVPNVCPKYIYIGWHSEGVVSPTNYTGGLKISFIRQVNEPFHEEHPSPCFIGGNKAIIRWKGECRVRDCFQVLHLLTVWDSFIFFRKGKVENRRA